MQLHQTVLLFGCVKSNGERLKESLVCGEVSTRDHLMCLCTHCFINHRAYSILPCEANAISSFQITTQTQTVTGSEYRRRCIPYLVYCLIVFTANKHCLHCWWRHNSLGVSADETVGWLSVERAWSYFFKWNYHWNFSFWTKKMQFLFFFQQHNSDSSLLFLYVGPF